MDNAGCTVPAPANNCLFTGCCQLPFMYTCYQKHETFAQCRKNGCPTDGSWMCTVLSDMPPSPPPSPPPCDALLGRTKRLLPPDWCNVDEERRAQREVCEDAYMALDNGRVNPCVHHLHSHSCKGSELMYCPPAMPSPPISPSPPNPPPAPPSQPPMECTVPMPRNNCIESRCCKQPDRFTCYKKNEHYAQCRSNGCDENDDWSCEVLINPPSPPPLPWSPPPSPPTITQQAAGASLTPLHGNWMSSSCPTPTAGASHASPPPPDTRSQQPHSPAVVATAPEAPCHPFLPLPSHQNSAAPSAFSSPTSPPSLLQIERARQQPQGNSVSLTPAGASSASGVPVMLSVVLVVCIAVVCSFRSSIGSAVKRQLLKRLGRTQLLGDDATSAKDDEGGVEDPRSGPAKGVSANTRSRHRKLGSADAIPADDVPPGEESESGVQLDPGLRL